MQSTKWCATFDPQPGEEALSDLGCGNNSNEGLRINDSCPACKALFPRLGRTISDDSGLEMAEEGFEMVGEWQ